MVETSDRQAIDLPAVGLPDHGTGPLSGDIVTRDRKGICHLTQL